MDAARKEVERMDVEKREKVERRRKKRLMCYLREMKRNRHILPVTTK